LAPTRIATPTNLIMLHKASNANAAMQGTSFRRAPLPQSASLL
jgi:hypothetical protein